MGCRRRHELTTEFLMTYPTHIVRQAAGEITTVGAAESRAASQASMLLDIPIIVSNLAGLAEHADLLRGGGLPIGSVEFVREAMRVAGIHEPANMTYPRPLRKLLRRRVEQRAAGTILGTHFIKPVTTKAFTGFVFDTLRPPNDYSEDDRPQYEAFMALDPAAKVWTSELVKFACEWRYYVVAGEIISAARYDAHGLDDAPEPDLIVVERAVVDMGQGATARSPAAYAIDFGVLDSGETALVEVNDGFALGLYGRSVDSKAYLALLTARWNQLVSLSPLSSIVERAELNPHAEAPVLASGVAVQTTKDTMSTIYKLTHITDLALVADVDVPRLAQALPRLIARMRHDMRGGARQSDSVYFGQEHVSSATAPKDTESAVGSEARDVAGVTYRLVSVRDLVELHPADVQQFVAELPAMIATLKLAQQKSNGVPLDENFPHITFVPELVHQVVFRTSERQRSFTGAELIAAQRSDADANDLIACSARRPPMR